MAGILGNMRRRNRGYKKDTFLSVPGKYLLDVRSAKLTETPKKKTDDGNPRKIVKVESAILHVFSGGDDTNCEGSTVAHFEMQHPTWTGYINETVLAYCDAFGEELNLLDVEAVDELNDLAQELDNSIDAITTDGKPNKGKAKEFADLSEQLEEVSESIDEMYNGVITGIFLQKEASDSALSGQLIVHEVGKRTTNKGKEITTHTVRLPTEGELAAAGIED